jgi:uncharacterized protein YjiK
VFEIRVWHSGLFAAILSISGCSPPDTAPPGNIASASDLSEYRLVEGPMVLKGINDNASGLTWDWDSDTLVIAINAPAILVRVNTKGQVLKQAKVTFAEDIEGITYLGDGRFALIEERRARVDLVRWDEGGLALESQFLVADAPLTARTNRGPEGIAFNRHDQSLRIVNEQWPRRHWVTRGALTGMPAASDCDGGESLDDWAGLSAIPESPHFLLMSEQTRRIVELDQDCHLVASLDLAQAGLPEVPQPEGLILDGAGNLFVVSEPNLLYRLENNSP